MTLQQLQYFIELNKWKSFSKAALNLNISQPALSLQLQKLEEELEFKLIDRTKTPFILSLEGETFHEKAMEILKMVDSLKDLSIDLSDKIKGTLRIGIIPTLAPYFVSLFIDKLEDKYPEMKLDISELTTERIIQAIKSGDIDAGILATPVETNNIQFLPLFYEKFFLYISEKHSLFKKKNINIEDIDSEELWYLKEGNCFQYQVDTLCKNPRKKLQKHAISYSSNSIESLRRIVESRKGITFIPELATVNIPPHLEDMVNTIKGDVPVREISIATSKINTKKKLIDAFLDLALEKIPARMKNQPKAKILDSGITTKKD